MSGSRVVDIGPKSKTKSRSIGIDPAKITSKLRRFRVGVPVSRSNNRLPSPPVNHNRRGEKIRES